MKFKDYYHDLGLERDATQAAIKGAYRKLAHKFHPDVSKDPEGEAKFKKIAEAYQTLKDPEKRAAYDQLGEHTVGQEFHPPPQWESQFRDAANPGERPFDDVDLADLFAGLSGKPRANGRHRTDLNFPGRDYEATATISVEEAFHGTHVNLNMGLPEIDADGHFVEIERKLRARIPRGAISGQRLRLRAQGGKGINGGRDGDLYVTVQLRPHALFRVDGRDLYLDLPLAPWEAALGASIEVPTLGGAVRLRVPPSTAAGQKLRLLGRGLPSNHGAAGDFFAVACIVTPSAFSEREQVLMKELAEISTFNPRTHFKQDSENAL